MGTKRFVSWLLLLVVLFVCFFSDMMVVAEEECSQNVDGTEENGVFLSDLEKEQEKVEDQRTEQDSVPLSPEKVTNETDPDSYPDTELVEETEDLKAEEEIASDSLFTLDSDDPVPEETEEQEPVSELESEEQEITKPTFHGDENNTEEQPLIAARDGDQQDTKDKVIIESPGENRDSETDNKEELVEPSEDSVRSENDKYRIQQKLTKSFTSGEGNAICLGTNNFRNDVLLESDHPYEPNEDRYWTLVSNGEAAVVSFTFSDETVVEDGHDFIILYNARGAEIGRYTGNELSGKTIVTAGNEVTIRLVTDSIYSEYGFSLTDCKFLEEVPIKSIVLQKGPQIKISWSLPFCEVGFEVQRAIVNPATGDVGEYRDIGTVNTDSFVDKNIVWGMVYSYRIRAYKSLVDQGKSYRYYSEYCSDITYLVRTPQISGGFGSKWYQGVVINWKAVRGAKKYIVYRSETSDGNYLRVGETADLTFTDMIPERKNYYYKLRVEAVVRGIRYISLPSESFMAGYIGKPEKLKAQPLGQKKVRLQWEESAGAAGYVIYRSQNPDSGYQYITWTTAKTITTYVPRQGEVYYYRIRACTKTQIYSGFSDSVAVLSMDRPENVRHVTHTKTSVTLRWDAVPGADYYKIFRSYTETNWPAFGETEETTYTFTELQESYQYAYFVVKAYKKIKLGNRDMISISPASRTLSVEKNMVNFRYLAVFEEDYPGTAEDRPTYGNNETLFSEIIRKATPYGRPVVSGGTAKNITKAELISRIMSGLGSQADSNDISLFYINCHGNESITTGAYAGQLKLSDGQTMTLQELAGLLQAVKGRVVVIIDSCGSGSAVLDDTKMQESGFNKAVVKAFQNVDSKILITEPASEEKNYDVLPLHGEFRLLNKFYVVTACEAGRKGYGNYQGTILLKRLNSAIESADIDRNGVIVMRELEKYLKTTGSEPLPTISGIDYMLPQVYPTNSSFEIFRKR